MTDSSLQSPDTLATPIKKWLGYFDL